MNHLTHLEIPAENLERARKFYEGLFDWQFNFMEEMNYLMFQMSDPEGKPAGSGGILMKQGPQHVVTNYINVEDIDAAIARIKELGGKVPNPKQAVPGMGWFAHFLDSEGNLLALWQNDPNAR
ncbi:MAG: VOC family protein [Calditrichia bacterium]